MSNPSPPRLNLYGDAKLYSGARTDLSYMADPHNLGSLDIPLAHNPGDTSTGISWNPKIHQGHALTFGPTRKGKGTSAIIPALLTYSGSMGVVDIKGENCHTTAPRRRMMGQRTVLLDPWNEVNTAYGDGETIEEVTHYNPLSELDASDPNFADEVSAYGEALIRNSGGPDSHWPDSARELSSGIVAMVKEAKGDKASLADVRWLLTRSKTVLAELIGEHIKRFPDGVAARKLASFVDVSENDKELSSIKSTARTQTAFLDSAKLSEALKTAPSETVFLDDPRLSIAPENPSPFRMRDLVRERITLYLVLPIDRLETHSRWLRLMLTLMIRAVSQNKIPPREPVLLLIDEMGTIGALREVEQSFGLIAGKGLRLWGFLQDLGQLKNDYPHSWSTFLENADVKQVLYCDGPETSDWFSDYLGMTTVEEVRGSSLVTRPYYLSPFQIAAGDRLFNSYTGWMLKREPVAVWDTSHLSEAEHVQLVRKLSYEGWNCLCSVPGFGLCQLEWFNYTLSGINPQVYVNAKGQYWVSETVLEPDLQRHERPLMLPQEIREFPESQTLVIVGRNKFLMDRFLYYIHLSHWVRPIPWYDNGGPRISDIFPETKKPTRLLSVPVTSANKAPENTSSISFPLDDETALNAQWLWMLNERQANPEEVTQAESETGLTTTHALKLMRGHWDWEKQHPELAAANLPPARLEKHDLNNFPLEPHTCLAIDKIRPVYEQTFDLEEKYGFDQYPPDALLAIDEVRSVFEKLRELEKHYGFTGRQADEAYYRDCRHIARRGDS